MVARDEQSIPMYETYARISREEGFKTQALSVRAVFYLTKTETSIQ